MNLERFAYDASYEPPAPVVQILLSNPVDPSQQTQVWGLVDTGADITVVLETLVLSLQLIRQGEIQVGSFDGIFRLHPVFLADIQIGQLRLDLVEVIAAATNELILGRNVLNQLDLRLNGPQLVLEVMNA
ncbi:retroviral-like aspartic protease family protein [Fervidibacter sacchari]